jgi:hypothetical protein
MATLFILPHSKHILGFIQCQVDKPIPYALTREFHFSIGFTPLFESEVFWVKENPAVVLIKSI